MSNSQSVRFFTFLFTCFGFYFSHCVEAKAEIHYSSTQFARHCAYQKHSENSQLRALGSFTGTSDLNKWIPGAFTIPEVVVFHPAEMFRAGMLRTFQSVGVKEFRLYSGLSPPYQFA